MPTFDYSQINGWLGFSQSLPVHIFSLAGHNNYTGIMDRVNIRKLNACWSMTALYTAGPVSSISEKITFPCFSSVKKFLYCSISTRQEHCFLSSVSSKAMAFLRSPQLKPKVNLMAIPWKPYITVRRVNTRA